MFPMIGGLFVILVFCTMIGFLIVEPGAAERKRMRKREEAKREARLRRVAAESWTTQPDRVDNSRHMGE